MTDDEMKRKLELFCEHKSVVHIDTVWGRFYNGIISSIGTDFVLLRDRILGDTFILFSEVNLWE